MRRGGDIGKTVEGVTVKPNATKHTRVYGPHTPVDSTLVENEIKLIYVGEILQPRVNSEFPIRVGLGINGSDRVTTNSCTTANIHDPHRFRETESDKIGSELELCHFQLHNDEKRYESRKAIEKALPTVHLEIRTTDGE